MVLIFAIINFSSARIHFNICNIVTISFNKFKVFPMWIAAGL